MLRNLNVTLEEVLEVRDYPLDEHQLWALLRNIINVLSTTKGQFISTLSLVYLYLNFTNINIFHKYKKVYEP